MNCYICRKEMVNDTDFPICIDCKEAGYLLTAMYTAFREWNMTLSLEKVLWRNTKKFIDSKISEVDKSQNIITQANDLADILIELIDNHLRIYNKNDLVVALLIIKEAVRRTELKHHKQFNEWFMVNEYELALRLIESILEKRDDYFWGAPIGYLENGYSNFITAIALARFYILLKLNIEMVKYFEIENLDIRDIAFEAIETEETEKYYREYIKMGLNEKPEDYKIENMHLNKKLDVEGKSMHQIKKDVNQVISKKFGFTLDDLKTFTLLIRDEFETAEDFPAFVDSKEIFSETVPYLSIFNTKILKEKLFNNMSKSIFDNIINTFSINKIKPSNEFDNLRMLELRSIYEKDELIIFGRIDFMQNISTFEKFAISGHYIEYYMPELRNDKTVQKSQKKLSTYLAYVLADKLYLKGFKLPMTKTNKKLGSKFVPKAEIDKIKINGVNILREVGDIDVLALNEEKNQIILFEIKYFKPALSNKELISKDKSKIEDDEIIRKIKARDEVVRVNVKEIANKFGWDSSKSYTIRSILITSRPNFYACNYINDIEYFTWTNLMDMIEKGLF